MEKAKEKHLLLSTLQVVVVQVMTIDKQALVFSPPPHHPTIHLEHSLTFQT